MATMVATLVIQIGKLVWAPIKRHASYLFCYVQNVDTLGTEVNKLEQRVDEVQEDVNEALRRGDTIRDEVNRWLEKANNMKTEAQNVVDRSANTKCLKGSCFNPILCYKLGKEAGKKIITVGQLKNEGKFRRVARHPPPPKTESLLPDRDFQALPSTKASIKHILDALKNNGINIIGVHGMGGVGKTALMKEVARQVEQEEIFDKVVMVTVSQNAITKRIQADIGELLGLELKEGNELIRATGLSAKLRQVGKLLMILDDLWDKLDLGALRIPYGEEHKGCKIVITSRNLDVCRMMRSQINIEVKALQEEESWTLFNAFAGDVVDSNELSEIARNVVRECKGLPLAIKVLGLALRDKTDVSIWNAVLKRLRSSIPTDIPGMEKEVFEVIKYSFDHLGSEEAKLCFLFCCLSPEDEITSLKDVTWYMVGEGLMKFTETLDEAQGQVSFLLDNLKASGLLLEDNNEKGGVKLHDIVRDVAIWIAEKKYRFYSRPAVGLEEWPRNIKMEEFHGLSLMYNEIGVLPDDLLQLPNLHILLLNDNYKLEMIPDRFFSEMKSLRFLDLCRTAIPSLPTSLSGLMNLRVFDLRGCKKLRHLSGIGALKSLEVLFLSKNDGITVLPTELGELCNLRFLDLSFTKCKIPSNVISRLSRLEQLYMIGGFDEWQVQGSEDTNLATFTELACLSRLTTLCVNIRDERCFAQDLGHGCFQKLLTFGIHGCYREIQRVFDVKLRKVDGMLTITGLVVPDWAKLLLGRADGLLFSRCPGVKCLSDAGGADIPISTFSNIKALGLSGLDDLTELYDRTAPETFLSKLKELVVEECHKLTNIFSSGLMSSTQELEVLQVHQCNQLSHLFHYDSAPGGTTYDPILLPHLKVLTLSSLPQLTSLWKGHVTSQSHRSLQKLFIHGCDNLKYILSSALALEQLEVLLIGGCKKLEKLFLSDLPSQSQSFLPLKRLDILMCDSLVGLFSWRQVRRLGLLEHLAISKCQSMVSIIMSEEEISEQVMEDYTNVLPRLKFLYLMDLEIASFDKEGVSAFDWPSLETIYVTGCPNLKMLPLSSEGAPKLHSINGSEEWFRTLEWPNEIMKSRLQTLFMPTVL